MRRRSAAAAWAAPENGSSDCGIEERIDASHRCFAALDQVDDPAQRDHRPDQHDEVYAERDELAGGDGVLDHQSATDPDHRDRAQAAEQGEQRVKRPRYPGEREIAGGVLIV